VPKVKTNRSAAKRFKVTGTGKLVHFKGGKGHLNRKKSSRRLRQLNLSTIAEHGIENNIKKIMGI